MTLSDRARVLAMVAFLTSIPSLAHADGGERDPLVPFEEGRALVKAGRYAEALVKFEESFKIKPTSGAILNMADCYEKLGRYASAVSAFERASALSIENNKAEREKVAKERLAGLAPLVSRLTVRSSNHTDLTVTVDGVAVVVDRPQAIDGGDHAVRVEAHCRVPNEMHVTVGLRADDHVVQVEPGPPSNDPACGGPAPAINVVSSPAPTHPESSWGTQKTVAVVLGGASLVALGVGIGFGVSASSKQGALEGACRDYPNGCPLDRRDELEATHDDASRAAAYSTVGVVAGVVFLGAAVGLYLTAPKTSSRTASTPFRVVF